MTPLKSIFRFDVVIALNSIERKNELQKKFRQIVISNFGMYIFLIKANHDLRDKKYGSITTQEVIDLRETNELLSMYLQPPSHSMVTE